MSERVARASIVQGWMTPAELSWLESTASGKKLAIELGSWHGRSSVALGSARRVICVDTFIDQPQECGTGDDILEDFLYATRHGTDDIVPVRGSLADEAFVESLAFAFAGSADVVFIDASHDEQSVRRDIGIARRLLRPGGILCGHDYSTAWSGVVAAVNDLVPGFQRAADSIWWSKS